MTSSTSSTRAFGSAKARTPGTRSRNRSRRPGSRDATAPTGQPARSSATPSARPDGPGADDPDDRPLAGPACACGWAWSLACSTSPWRWCPCRRRSLAARAAPPPGRIEVDPCSSSSRSVSSCSSARRSAWRGGPSSVSSQALIGARAAERRSRAVRFHPTSVASGPRAHPHRPIPTVEISRAHAERLRRPASLGAGLPDLYRLDSLASAGLPLGVDLGRAPVTLKILLENALRHAGGGIVREEDVAALAAWRPGGGGEAEVPFMPRASSSRTSPACPRSWTSRRCATRWRPSAAIRAREPARARGPRDRPLRPDRRLGRSRAFAFNVGREYERNGERYQLLRWAQTAFRDLRVVPPAPGSSTRSTSSSSRRWSGTAPTQAAGSRSRTRSSGPTRTRR